MNAVAPCGCALRLRLGPHGSTLAWGRANRPEEMPWTVAHSCSASWAAWQPPPPSSPLHHRSKRPLYRRCDRHPLSPCLSQHRPQPSPKPIWTLSKRTGANTGVGANVASTVANVALIGVPAVALIGASRAFAGVACAYLACFVGWTREDASRVFSCLRLLP